MHTNQSKENFLKLSSSQVALEAPSQEQIKLSVMDNTVSEGITVHFYFCYDNPNQDVNFMEPEAMRESLSKLLGDYPWIGGALTVDDGGKYTINLNGYGVQFDIVRVDAPLNQFKFGSSDEFQKENLCSHWTGLSPCQIQLTYFVCGGVVLSAEFDHRLLDGESAVVFLQNWSKVHHGKPFTKPTFDRSHLQPSPSVDPNIQFPGHTAKLEHSYQESLKTRPPTVSDTIVFTSHELENMKKSAQDPSEYQVPWVSTNDALCAHMWRVVSRARGLGREESTIVIQANNLRKKMIPTKVFVGNMVYTPFTDPITVGELLSSPLSRSAAIVRRSINSVTEERIQNWIDYVSVVPRPQSLAYDKSFYGSNIIVSSLVSFDLYAVSFGRSPFNAGEVPALWEGLFRMYACKKKGDVEIRICLVREHMNKLLSDPELHKYRNVEIQNV
ncbi:shikimate O-hydroxycinnamoyltransferase [Acrasis kona]|uniref:Shikimate O-hydroxycinnamoyltransferase n=1 Tax=Acrasis kona TaxID=1008807 RepID=A0AAW2ZDA8_9EUKA